jgi:hypothetical protein
LRKELLGNLLEGFEYVISAFISKNNFPQIFTESSQIPSELKNFYSRGVAAVQESFKKWVKKFSAVYHRKGRGFLWI